MEDFNEEEVITEINKKLTEVGINGAEAGILLKRAILKMDAILALSDATLKQLSAYGIDVEKVAEQTTPIQKRLQELSKISEDSTALVKVFGVRDCVAGGIILGNVGSIHKKQL